MFFLSQRSGRSSCSTRGHAGDCGAEPGLPGRLFLSAWLLWVSAEGQKHRILENGYCSQGNGRKKRNGGNEGGPENGFEMGLLPEGVSTVLGGWVDEWMRLLRLVPVLPRTSWHCTVIPHTLRTGSTFFDINTVISGI